MILRHWKSSLPGPWSLRAEETGQGLLLHQLPPAQLKAGGALGQGLATSLS